MNPTERDQVVDLAIDELIKQRFGKSSGNDEQG